MEPTVVIPSKKRKTEVKTDYNKCVLCQTTDIGKPLRTTTQQGCERIMEVVQQRLSYDDSKTTDITSRLKEIDLLTISLNIYYHKTCYDKFTNSTHIKRLAKIQSTNVPSNEMQCSSTFNMPPRPLSRALFPPLDKSLCMFCQKSPKTRTSSVMTLALSDTILEAAKGDAIMQRRLAGISDLVAANTKYHNQCRIEFIRKMEKPIPEINVRDHCLSKVTDEIRAGILCGHVYTLMDVWHRYEHLLLQDGVTAGTYRDNKTRFKQKLEKALEGEIDFVPQLDNKAPQLLFPKASANTAVSAFQQKHDELIDFTIEEDLVNCPSIQNEETDHLLSMHAVAMTIRNQIDQSPGISNCMNINEEEADKVVPENLYLFLRLLLTGQDVPSDEEETDDALTRRKILTVAQDIVFLVSKGRKLTPKHIGLGMSIHQATRSKELVNLVHAAGHCINYSTVRQIDTAMAQRSVDDYRANGNVPIPSNIKPNHFFQFSADNIDIIEETLDGKGTFHATQMVTFQKGSKQHHMSLPPVVLDKDRKTLTVPATLHELTPAPRRCTRPSPDFNNNINISWFDTDESVDRDAQLSDLTWLLTRYNNADNQKVPFWTGFNQIMSEVSSDLTTVGFLPILNAPAHDNDTLWTVILRCLEISKCLNPDQDTVLTLDEQLYCKAKELQWSSPDICETLVLRLGGFHTALNFMKVIGKHFTDSGLTDVWIESSVFGENTATNNLLAKSYNRAIRAHKLTYEALLRILWPQFVTWLSDKDPSICQDLTNKARSLAAMIKNKEDVDNIIENYNAIKECILSYNLTHLLTEFQSTRTPTSQYWQQYIDMVSLLLRFIRAEREGNWKLHMSAMAGMLPWFAIYDHTNYTRWGAVYLADMSQLETTHPLVYEEFMSGNFGVKQSKSQFNQLPTDQALEHVNKVSKMSGGLVGITREDSARDRWCLTFNQRSQLVSDTYQLLGFHDRNDEHTVWEGKECNPSRLARDEADVQLLISQLSRFNAFRHELPNLVCLSTRDVAPDNIAQSLLSAEKRGKQEVINFVVHRLCEDPSTFHNSLPKKKSPTLATMYTVSVKGLAAGGKQKRSKLVEVFSRDYLCHKKLVETST